MQERTSGHIPTQNGCHCPHHHSLARCDRADAAILGAGGFPLDYSIPQKRMPRPGGSPEAAEPGPETGPVPLYPFTLSPAELCNHDAGIRYSRENSLGGGGAPILQHHPECLHLRNQGHRAADSG